tara:strand:+ start:1051 stop:2643 length:1593 start_codon:yes stop_codon:yes gene_type:complete
MSKEYIGTTIHTGWFPLLTSKRPVKSFHRGKSSRGVSARGYSKAFVKHVQAVSDAKGGRTETLELLDRPIMTERGASEAAQRPNAMDTGVLTRPRKWSDMVMSPKAVKDEETGKMKPQYDDASRFEDGMKKFQIRGNFVWYNKPNGGPKALAKAILENNFSFEKAEGWYRSNYGSAGPKMRDWATATLGMRGNEFIEPEEIEKLGDAVGETVLKGDKELKAVKGYPSDVFPKPRDIILKGTPAELTEGKLSEKHGYPEISAKDQADNEALKTVIETQAVRVWNQTVDAIIASEQKELKAKGKPAGVKAAGMSAIKKSATTLMAQTGANVTVDQMRRVSHEIADKLIGLGAGKSKSDFVELARADTIVNKQTGMRKYHRIELSVDRNFKFSLGKVSTVSGLEAGQAFLAGEKKSQEKQYKRSSLNRQIAFAHNYGKNTDATRTHGSMTIQSLNNINSGAGIKTEVSFSPEVGKEYVNSIIDRIGELTKTKLTNKEKEIQKAVRDKAVAYNRYGNIFWAAPYIGVEEGVKLG